MVFPKRIHQEGISQPVSPKRCEEFIANLISDFPEDDIKFLVSKATLGVYEVKPPKERRIRKDADRCMFLILLQPRIFVRKSK